MSSLDKYYIPEFSEVSVGFEYYERHISEDGDYVLIEEKISTVEDLVNNAKRISELIEKGLVYCKKFITSDVLRECGWVNHMDEIVLGNMPPNPKYPAEAAWSKSSWTVFEANRFDPKMGLYFVLYTGSSAHTINAKFKNKADFKTFEKIIFHYEDLSNKMVSNP